MYLSKRTGPSFSVVGRLTLWYALICALFCAGLFFVVSHKMARNLQVREDRSIQAELVEFSVIYAEGGTAGLQHEFDYEVEALGASKFFGRLLSPHGELIAASRLSGWEGLEAELEKIAAPAGAELRLDMLYPPDSPLHARLGSLRLPDGNLLQFGLNRHTEIRFFYKIQRVLLQSSVLMLILSTFSVWLIARYAIKGVRRVTAAVSLIQKNDLDHRVEYGREGREINQLAEAFNNMLVRIQTLIHEMKEVSDNVAHDLRSPITRMRGIAETTLTGPQEIDLYREMGFSVIEESDRLTEMINTILEIAQAESGLLDIQPAPVDLQEVLRNAIDLFEPVAQGKQIELNLELPGDPLVLFGDKNRLQRVVANLIDNAIKYTPPGGDVTCRACAGPDQITVEICDSGPGISPEEAGRIFNRFYRGEKSRSTPGNGLGLSLAQTIVEAHAGTLSVESGPDGGSVFRVRLPRERRMSA
jgi:heavy metal sensor kinase